MEEKEQFIENPDYRIVAILLLIGTTVLWGSTFIITKLLIKDIPIFFYLGIRFLFALLIFTPFLVRINKINKQVVWLGFLAGIVYFFAIAVQTIGLQTTTAGKGGFITGLNTVIVPFMAWALYKKPINKKIWIAVCLAIVGMALLLLGGEGGIAIGDLFILLCAFLFALYIILVDRDVELVDIYLYLIVQLTVITAFCFLFSFLFQESYTIFAMDISFWIIILYMGCIASGLTFLFQNWGQKQIGPTQTAIIFTLEPVFALLFASYLIGNEALTPQILIGCGLIFLAIIITVLESYKENGLLIEEKII